MILAAEWFRREHGVFPETIEKLVAAGVLDGVPLDALSTVAEPLSYQRDPSDSLRAKVWSAGHNGVNDGGAIDPQPGPPRDMGYWIGNRRGP